MHLPHIDREPLLRADRRMKIARHARGDFETIRQGADQDYLGPQGFHRHNLDLERRMA